MARIQKFKKSNRGRELHCSKCGKMIVPGEYYLKAEPYVGPAIIRCMSCGLRSYETSGSSYIQRIGEIVENWEMNYQDLETIADDIASDLEDIRDELEYNFDNIPEQLQDGAAGSLLQERMEELEDAIGELSGIDYDTIVEESRDDAIAEIGEFDSDDPDRTYATEEEWEEAIDEYMSSDIEDRLHEVISDALVGLSY